METVFGMELLLETILRNLGPGDLKETRRVSKQWNYRATRILLAKQLLSVHCAFQDSPNEEGMERIRSFQTTINQSPLFPSCSFAFSNCNLSNPNVEHILCTFGHMIHTLRVSLANENLPGIMVNRGAFLHSFKQLLFVQLPNLERLTLASKTPSIWDAENSEASLLGRSGEFNSMLPKLKFLRVQSALPEKVFEFLIGVGVNIEEVELGPFPHEQLLDALRRMNKMHLLISTMIRFQKDNLALIELFANAKLKIRKVHLLLSRIYLDSPSVWLQASQVMAKFLDTCAHSLKEMTIAPLFFFPQFPVPIMPRLQVLMIFVFENCSQVFAPSVFKMSRVFPRVSIIYIQYRPGMPSNNCSKEMYENNFLGADYQDTVSTVTNLRFEIEPEFVCIEKLPLLFPNIKNLTILKLFNLSQVLNVLWALPLLESLHFGVSIQTLESLQNPSWITTNTFTTLDAALTGICEETCAHLLSSSSESLDAATLNNLKLKKSMVDAKRLESLCIGIDDDSTELRSSPTKSVLSKVSLKYAFEMCPHVKVRIVLKGKHEDNVKYLLDGVSPVLSPNLEIKKETKSERLTHVTNYLYTVVL